jgi:chemotaxis protein MotB
MAKKCPKCECPAGEKWAVPFADFLSLLLALFIALYALASVNIEKQKALKEEFVKIYGFEAAADTMQEQDNTEKSKTDKVIDAAEEGKIANNSDSDKEATAEEIINKLSEFEKINVKSGNLDELLKGTFLSMPSHLLFEPGKAELTNKFSSSFLSKLAEILTILPDDTEINVKGYAEEFEVRSSKYQDALELSTARANNIVRELIKYKISPDRLYSSGFGSNKAAGLIDKRIVEFELKTMKKVDKENTSFDTIFDKMNDK